MREVPGVISMQNCRALGHAEIRVVIDHPDNSVIIAIGGDTRRAAREVIDCRTLRDRRCGKSTVLQSKLLYTLFLRTGPRPEVHMSVPICRGSHLLSQLPPDLLNDLRVSSCFVVSSQPIAIHYVDVPVLTARDREMRIGPTLIWKQQHASRTEIEVVLRHICLIIGSEEVGQRDTMRIKTELYYTIAEVDTGLVTISVKRSIGGRKIEIAIMISGYSASAHPNTTLITVRGRHPGPNLA